MQKIEQYTIYIKIPCTDDSLFTFQDTIIKEESAQYKITGGCTALVALFFMGKLYIANAGDSRGVLIEGGNARAVSNDFTPDSERERIQTFVSRHQLEFFVSNNT